MFENLFNKSKQNPAEGANIYHLSEAEIDRLREKITRDAETERKERESRLAKEMDEREEAERVRRLLQQEEAQNKEPYVITEKDRKEAEELVEKL